MNEEVLKRLLNQIEYAAIDYGYDCNKAEQEPEVDHPHLDHLWERVLARKKDAFDKILDAIT